ncbi:hypothetical protein BIV57_12660 [Mangrovactinospora gilvigrisea]|uniref:Lipoprotein n=2 Tax=Mangrovactinospora gilvigrisea TaxID=1428644 RepID=A0A1J7BF21_9ACTN|nr:hypothetical protein BIV57_12660 [Mangrovactinospora gilvigrisea]
MRTRTARLAAQAAAVGAALGLLSACGSSGGGKDKINTGQSGKPAASTTASPSSSAAAGAPTPSLPVSAKDVFEDQSTGDATKDAVLADNAKAVTAIDDAIFKQSLKAPALNYYLQGSALVGADKYVKGWIDSHEDWVGKVRFFNRKLTMMSDGTASVIYCSDESKANIKDAKTGKVDTSSGGGATYVLYNTRLTKNKQGVWQTTFMVSQRGARQCKP